MKINEKKINQTLKNEVFNQYCEGLIIATKTKQLFLKPNLSIKDLSNETGIPVEEVNTVLREKLKLTFFEFLSEFKVNRAKKLLTNISEDQLSFSSIAAQSGFNTKDSFLTIFEEHTKMSPKEYRIKYFTIDHDSSARLEN